MARVKMYEIYDDLPFDAIGFANFPKRAGNWFFKDGSGCLLSAMWVGGWKFVWGNFNDYQQFQHPVHKTLHTRATLGKVLNRIAPKLLGVKNFNSFVGGDVLQVVEARFHRFGRAPKGCECCICTGKPLTFCQAISFNFDRGDSPQAVALAWDLIERLPRRQGTESVSVILLPDMSEVPVCHTR